MKRESGGLHKIILLILGGSLVLIVWMNYMELSGAPETIQSPPLVTGIAALPDIPDQQDSVSAEGNDGLDDIKEGASVLNLTVIGDILPHAGLNTEAKTEDGYDYTKIMSGAQSYIENADFAVASSFETTMPGGPEFSGYPTFKTPDAIASSLKALGVDLVNTANDHCMDSYETGLVRTLDVLDQAGLYHVGTYRSREERDATSGITFVEQKGITMAFLSYTFGTNGVSIEEYDFVTNVYALDYLSNTSNEINYGMIESDMEAARNLNADIITVFMHWGQELQTIPVRQQTELADFLLEQGADIIIGGHPQVPERMELRKIEEDTSRTGLVVYSLGNFISAHSDILSKISAIVNVEIVKDNETGETSIRDANYIPMIMVDLDDYGIEQTDWRYQLWDLHSAVDAYDSGYDMGVINYALSEGLKAGLNEIHGIMGRDYDRHHRYG